ncbi:MAG: hypothetical protein C4334_01615 [Pyrinomonas sp.]|uniref:cation diffusion facilitator family transporter n=1 Tax=Pyrinomonas sp. TaxID=2080306 RepID=UPI00331DA847
MRRAEEQRADVVRHGLRLGVLTVGWNALEALISIVAGTVAGSIALIGFGLDSVIETSSGAVMFWRLATDRDGTRRDARERRALRLIGFCFLALAAYVGYEATASLIAREAPDASPIGIALATLSLIVMPLLARAKRKVAGEIGSHAMRADARQTDICAYLSAILLGGLVLNALFGWWWADAVAALLMTPIIVKEGVQALRGKSCAGCC